MLYPPELRGHEPVWTDPSGGRVLHQSRRLCKRLVPQPGDLQAGRFARTPVGSLVARTGTTDLSPGTVLACLWGRGDVAQQQGERSVRNAEVVGSIPAVSTKEVPGEGGANHSALFASR